MRADQLLLQRQLATSRAQAQRLIASGVRWRPETAVEVAWKTVGKNSDELPVDAHIELLDVAEARYVSRGGLKLEGALKATGVAVAGKTCLDVGQSTGGFTDCLLQHGASRVVGVDVGQGQLHPAMRAHPQVVALEHINARELSVDDILAAVEDHEADAGPDDEGIAFDGQFDVIVGDLSFISQTLVLPALVPLLKADGHLLMLVKPQFELQPGQVGKGGIVKDASLYAFVENRIRDCLAELGMKVLHWMDSPITGGDGNREFFVHAVPQPA
jgi:23S rRNA (cytidine1920-2'-O)/16S rRNA (cytidine1409-2'-O)-methyltransferase